MLRPEVTFFVASRGLSWSGPLDSRERLKGPALARYVQGLFAMNTTNTWPTAAAIAGCARFGLTPMLRGDEPRMDAVYAEANELGAPMAVEDSCPGRLPDGRLAWIGQTAGLAERIDVSRSAYRGRCRCGCANKLHG